MRRAFGVCLPAVVGALLAGCADGGNGTAVGNPGHLDVILTDVPYDVSLEAATFHVTAVELVGCDREVEILRLDATFDALAPSPVDFPGGEWCHTVVLPGASEAFRVSGTVGDEPFDLGLSPEPFALTGRYTVDGDTVLLSLSLAAAVRDDAGASAPNQAEADSSGTWAPAVMASGLLLAQGPDYAAADPVDVEHDAGGCSTAGAAGSTAGALVGLGLMGMRRRR